MIFSKMLDNKLPLNGFNKIISHTKNEKLQNLINQFLKNKSKILAKPRYMINLDVSLLFYKKRLPHEIEKQIYDFLNLNPYEEITFNIVKHDYYSFNRMLNDFFGSKIEYWIRMDLILETYSKIKINCFIKQIEEKISGMPYEIQNKINEFLGERSEITYKYNIENTLSNKSYYKFQLKIFDLINNNPEFLEYMLHYENKIEKIFHNYVLKTYFIDYFKVIIFQNEKNFQKRLIQKNGIDLYDYIVTMIAKKNLISESIVPLKNEEILKKKDFFFTDIVYMITNYETINKEYSKTHKNDYIYNYIMSSNEYEILNCEKQKEEEINQLKKSLSYNHFNFLQRDLKNPQFWRNFQFHENDIRKEILLNNKLKEIIYRCDRNKKRHL